MKRKYTLIDGKWVPDIPETDEDRQRHAANVEEMLRLHRFPNMKTDKTLRHGIGTLLSQCGGNEFRVRQIVDAAKKHGHTPNPNYWYVPTLAKCTGDREAFIPPSEGAGYIKRLCEKRGISCQGMVEHEPARLPPAPSKPLAERTIRRYEKELLSKDPTLGRDRRALRERITQEHSYESAYKE